MEGKWYKCNDDAVSLATDNYVEDDYSENGDGEGRETSYIIFCTKKGSQNPEFEELLKMEDKLKEFRQGTCIFVNFPTFQQRFVAFPDRALTTMTM
jgi:hypothetical protein